MTLTLRHLAFLLALLSAAGCSPAAPPPAVALEILVTTDLHGHLEHSAADNKSGGWLRLATLIRNERAVAGADHTLLIDCGDTTQGTFDAAESHGGTGLAALKTLGYDAWVPGNHEFDYGLPRLHEFVREMNGCCLAGNLELADATAPGRYRRLPAWKLFERGGARIAVIGVTASYLDQWFWSGAVPGFRVEKALATVARILPEVHRAKPDVIVLAAHQGWLPNDPRGVNELAEIARRFPEIDLILGGHTHQPVPGRKIGSRTWYVQADCNASAFGVVRLKVDVAKHEVWDIQSELRAAGADIPPDAALGAATRELRSLAAQSARQVAGSVPLPVSGTGTPGADCGSSELIGRAMMAATGAGAAVHGKFTDGGLGAGAVTGFDLFRLLPFENGIVVAQLTPAEIGRVLTEQDGAVSERGVSPRGGLSGLRAVRSPDGSYAIRGADGRPLPEDHRIPVAFNSYAAAGGGGRFPLLRALLRRPETNAADAGITTREALRRFLEKHQR